jgi:hypothetical protein
MSLDPVVMPKITGNTAMFIARARHKKDNTKIHFGKGRSQAEAREDAIAQIHDVTRSANPDDYNQFTLDLNVNFTNEYLDPKSGNYFKMAKDDAGQPVLVMASREYFANFGKEMEDLGFRKASSRIKATSVNSTPIYALPISRNAVKTLGLIPNMRYTLEPAEEDSDGNLMFGLRADTRTLGKNDKYRMGVPGLTLAASVIEATMEDQNPTDKISMDIPLFLRMLEYAKEDAKTDMDLHQVTARAIELMQQHDYLCMDNYDTIVNNSEPIDEGWLDKVYAAGRNFADTATLGGYKYARAGADYAAKNIGNKLGFDVEPTTYQKELDQEVEKLDKDWEQEPGAALAGIGSAMVLPLAGQYGAAVKRTQGLGSQALDAYGKFVKTYPLAKKALGFEGKSRKNEDTFYQNPNMTPDQIDKMNKTIQKTLKNRPYDVDKSAKDPRAFQQRLPQGKDTAPMPEYNRDVPSLMKTAPRKPSSQKMVTASAEVDEEKKGLYYYVNKRKKAGTSRPASHPKAPSDQDWKNAAKTAKKESIELEEGLLGKAVGLIGFYYGAKLGLPDAIMNTMDLPLGTYEIMQHLLGAGVGAVAGSAVGDVVGAGAKKLIAKMLWGAITKAAQSIKGGTPQQQAMKNLDAEVKEIEARIKQSIATGGKAEPKLFNKNPQQNEAKKMSAKDDPCWTGYKMVGHKKKNGREVPNCVPGKKGS